MPTHPKPTWEHAQSRYQYIPVKAIHKLQSDFLAGRDLGNSIPEINENDAAVIVAESLEADIIWNLDTVEVLTGGIKKRRMSDFKRAVMSEILITLSDHAYKRDDKQDVKTLWALEKANLQELASTPTASPLLDYAEIYFDLALNSTDSSNKDAIEWMKKRLSHELQYNEGNNAVVILHDLADLYLSVKKFDQGLSILTAILKYDPANIWIYNKISVAFDGYGLGSLGAQAAKRGIKLIEFQGDKEGIKGQFEDALEPAQDRKGKAYKIMPSVLTEFQRALQLDFRSRSSIPIAQLCREAIPDFDHIPVKRPLTSEDFPLPDQAEILPVLQEIQKAKSFFSRLARIFSRKL
jgi:tetratricopeptide (TPR) repeat protein